MAHLLRKSPFFCFTVLAGHDADGPALYWIDYMATMQKVKTAAQGYIQFMKNGLNHLIVTALTSLEVFSITNGSQYNIIILNNLSQQLFRI